MEDQTWSCDLSTASRSYRSKLKSHFEAELYIDFEEMDGEDELNTVYPCPFCADDFDLLDLWCHIDEDHCLETKTGICPLCVSWVGTNLVEHILAQHGHLPKSQHKSGYRKLESYRTLSLSRKNLQDEDGYWQSFPAESSPETSTPKTARDPLLSFLYCAAADDDRENVRPDSSSEVFVEEIHPKESELARDVQPSLSDDKDQMGKAQRSEFVQGLFMSTILDPDF